VNASGKPASGKPAPGKLLGMRLAVLAAEMTDADRFRRGRVYQRTGNVEDLLVTPGLLMALVHGSRWAPYDVNIGLREPARHSRANPIPRVSSLFARCTCPDGPGTCKHAAAVMLEFADRVMVDPDLFELWRPIDDDAPYAGDDGLDLDLDPSDGEPPGAGGAADDDPLVDFFGVRSADSRLDWRPGTFDLPPLRPARPRAASAVLDPIALQTVALDALDAATDLLRTMYGHG
jgi:hypothetical protein